MEVKEININGDIHIHLNMNESYEPCEDLEEEHEEFFTDSLEDLEETDRSYVSLGEAIDYLTENFYMLDQEKPTYDKGRYIYRGDKPEQKIYFGRISNIYALYTVDSSNNHKLFIPFDVDYQHGWVLCSEE